MACGSRGRQNLHQPIIEAPVGGHARRKRASPPFWSVAIRAMSIVKSIRPDIIARFEGQRAPRYTSYPTAPHFTHSFDDADYQTLLTGLPPDGSLSLYLHVPFCQTMCWYCGCHTRIVASYSPIEAYLRALEGEIRMVAAALPQRMKVRHIHWGGGTPTIMAPEAFENLTGVLRDCFDVAQDAEIAVEIDPRRITDDMIRALGGSGVTRASLGVQSFDPAVQKAINRIQSYEQTARTTDTLRDMGIEAVNFDLIYGLPYQTVASCEDTVTRALRLEPDQLSVFGYAHVPWMKKHQRMIETSALPNPRQRLEQFGAISACLAAAGYRRIGLDHFARPDDQLVRCLDAGTLHRNFQGYTSDQCTTLLGFGASAVGTLPQAYLQNTTQVGDYRRRIEAGSFAIQRGRRVTAEDRLRRDVIERIMCDFKVDLAAVAANHGLRPEYFMDEIARLADLEQDGIVRLEGAVVSLDEAYWPLARTVAAVFDAYLQPEEQRHAAAI
jgi:oxygen-independent coproporphyrinogen-3 oxidase